MGGFFYKCIGHMLCSGNKFCSKDEGLLVNMLVHYLIDEFSSNHGDSLKYM